MHGMAKMLPKIETQDSQMPKSRLRSPCADQRNMTKKGNPTVPGLITPSGPSQGLRLKFLLSHATVGGLTISLNSAVPQTSSAKPATCSHLKLSQPRPSETSQMKSVRQVSIVLRAVAEIWRVTERPKKLKPLWEKDVKWKCAEVDYLRELDLPDGNHN